MTNKPLDKPRRKPAEPVSVREKMRTLAWSIVQELGRSDWDGSVIYETLIEMNDVWEKADAPFEASETEHAERWDGMS